MINQEYSHLGPQTTPREDQTRMIEKRLLEKILIYSDNNGISHKNLANILGMDRKTLRKYIKPLIEKNLVLRETSRQGKYYPSTGL